MFHLMRKSGRLSVLLTTIFVALLGIACHRTGSESAGYTIAVIPKGTTHEFWKSIHAGAVKAERELNSQGVKVSVIWKGPLREDDREQQIQVVEGFVSQGISGIVLAPLDDRALIRPVEDAKSANIPTVIIDSALQSPNIASFVATDNLKG
ncbi:MAG: substrate-binding domain-containing protein, partial [Blastocatellia bacterium]